MSTTTETTPQIIKRSIQAFEAQVRRLLVQLKADIGDEYRASDEDTLPSMQVTIGATLEEDGTFSWTHQTGDNSYTGGCYSHANWGVISLYRRSNSRELAKDAVSQILDSIGQ